jgi:hypothetical protein
MPSAHCGTIAAWSRNIEGRVYIKPVQEFLESHVELIDLQMLHRRPSIEDGTRALGWLSHDCVGARARLPVGAYVYFELDACDVTSASLAVLSSLADEFSHASQWACHACTYQNAHDFLNCEMCFTARSLTESDSDTVAAWSAPPDADIPTCALLNPDMDPLESPHIRSTDQVSYDCSKQEDVSPWVREAETDPALLRVFLVLWRSSATLRGVVKQIVERHGHKIAFKAMDRFDEMAEFQFEACFYWSDWAVLIKDAQRKDDASLANSIAFELANGFHHAEFAELFSTAEETTKRHASQATSFAMQAEAIEKKSVDLQKRVMCEAIGNGTGEVTAEWAWFGTDSLPWFHPDHLYPQGTQLVWLADTPHFEYWRRVYIDRFQWGCNERAEYLAQREMHSGNREQYEHSRRSYSTSTAH